MLLSVQAPFTEEVIPTENFVKLQWRIHKIF